MQKRERIQILSRLPEAQRLGLYEVFLTHLDSHAGADLDKSGIGDILESIAGPLASRIKPASL